jgi:hypothetical protein
MRFEDLVRWKTLKITVLLYVAPSTWVESYQGTILLYAAQSISADSYQGTILLY